MNEFHDIDRSEDMDGLISSHLEERDIVLLQILMITF